MPLYLNEEFIDNIEIYNPTQEQAIEIRHCIEENLINDGLRFRLLGELTNINIDCEINDDIYKYYGSIFKIIMIEIDSIITEIALDYALEMEKILNKSEDKIKTLNGVFTKFNTLIENNDNELLEIKIQKDKEKEKKELERIMDEAKIKLENIK